MTVFIDELCPANSGHYNSRSIVTSGCNTSDVSEEVSIPASKVNNRDVNSVS